MDTVSLLKEVNFFASLDEDVLGLLQKQLHHVSFESGDELCREGEAGDCMFIIESGEVAVTKQSTEGAPIEITTLGSGDIAGEMSLLGQMRRSAALTAKTDVTAWVLEYGEFQSLLQKHASLSRALLASLTKNLQRETSVVARLMAKDLDHRFKIAFFDNKSYMQRAFEQANDSRYSLRFFESRLSEETVSLAAGCQAVCVFVNDTVDAEVIEELHGMGIDMIALRCAGYNNVDLEACERLGVSVARVPAYSPYAVAEHAVALMLTLNRRTHRASNRIREGNFSLSGFVGFDMHGRTAGVIGTGKIGKCAMRILSGFGCRVLAYDKFPDDAFAKEIGAEYVDLDRLLAESDIITLHAPLLPETHHMISADAIDKMKDGVMIVNTSRGGLVDTAALLAGLKSRKIGYAGLDVYEEESAYFFEDFSSDILTDDMLARLTTFNNVIVTSHQAFLTREALANIAETTLQNICEYQGGKVLGDLTHAVVAPKKKA